MEFEALNIDFSSASPDPLCSRRPAQGGVKYGYLAKVVILLLFGRAA